MTFVHLSYWPNNALILAHVCVYISLNCWFHLCCWQPVVLAYEVGKCLSSHLRYTYDSLSMSVPLVTYNDVLSCIHLHSTHKQVCWVIWTVIDDRGLLYIVNCFLHPMVGWPYAHCYRSLVRLTVISELSDRTSWDLTEVALGIYVWFPK
jgi:hypothetical protein